MTNPRGPCLSSSRCRRGNSSRQPLHVGNQKDEQDDFAPECPPAARALRSRRSGNWKSGAIRLPRTLAVTNVTRHEAGRPTEARGLAAQCRPHVVVWLGRHHGDEAVVAGSHGTEAVPDLDAHQAECGCRDPGRRTNGVKRGLRLGELASSDHDPGSGYRVHGRNQGCQSLVRRLLTQRGAENESARPPDRVRRRSRTSSRATLSNHLLPVPASSSYARA